MYLQQCGFTLFRISVFFFFFTFHKFSKCHGKCIIRNKFLYSILYLCSTSVTAHDDSRDHDDKTPLISFSTRIRFPVNLVYCNQILYIS